MNNMFELKNILKRFSKQHDFTSRVTRRGAQMLGFGMVDETVHAVDGVTIGIHRGAVVGLVGESGCGKSTLGRIVVGIHPQSEEARWWRGRAVALMTSDENVPCNCKRK